MKLKVDFTRLEKARESMGAAKVKIGALRNMTTFSGNPIEVRLKKEGQVILSAEEVLKDLHHPGDLLAVGNTQITLHIYEPGQDKENIPDVGPRFHITDCKTLQAMRDGGRLNRYVVGDGTEGYFRVIPYNHPDKRREKEISAKLIVCWNCLMRLDYKNFDGGSGGINRKRDIVKHFSVEEFFAENKSFFRCLPLYTPETFPGGDYTHDWPEVSRRLRAKHGWQCSCCRVNLHKNRGLLHTHHKDGIRGNNNRSNLRPLCVLCHQKQDFHEKMHVERSDREDVIRIRKVQDIAPHCSKCGS